jgi:cell division protein FtsA
MKRKGHGMSRTIAAIDYGTSKIACVIARAQSSGAYDVLGFGNVPYAGYADGNWNEPEKLAEVTTSVLHEAGIVAKRKIRKIYIAVPGDYTMVANYRVGLDVTAADRRVTKEDAQRLLHMAPAPEKGARYALLHRCPVYYMLDTQERLDDPVGQRTSALSAMVSTVLGDKRFLAQTHNLMDYLGVDVKGFVSAMIGQASFMIPRAEKDIGCVLIDSGFATTTIAILQGEGILYQKTIPFGAKQVITDMMTGLNISYSEADALKRRYVFGLDNASGQMQLMHILDRTDKARKYETALVSEVIEARMRDTIERIDQVIEQSGFRLANRSTVYLTGGGFAMMNGIRQFVSAILGRNVQVLTPQSPRINSAVYAGVLGVVDYICMQTAAQKRPWDLFHRKK